MRPVALLARMLLVAATAYAMPSPAGAAEMEVSQHLLDADGNPLMVANTRPDGSVATPSWRICSPGCTPDAIATGNVLRPGSTAAGTTFEASAVVDGVTIVDRSRPWTGAVENVAAPTVTGELKVGGIVTAGAGAWVGGWGDDVSSTSLRACPTAAATDCRVLLSATPAAIIDSAYAGWFIGAVDSRYGREAPFPAVAFPMPTPGVPSAIPAPAPGPTVAAGPLVGPVAAAPQPSPTPSPTPKAGPPGLGFTPRVSLRKRQGTTAGRRTVGTVRCKARCAAKVVLNQGKEAAAYRLVIRKGSRAIGLPSTFSSKRRVRVVVGFEGSSVVVKGWVGARRR